MYVRNLKQIKNTIKGGEFFKKVKMTVYARAKRGKKKQLNKKKLTTVIILLVLVIAIAYFVISNHLLELRNEQEEANTNVTQDNTVEEAIVEPKQDEIVDVELPEKMGNYEVLGQLVIDKIGVTKNILDNYDNDALALSVGQLCGPNLNESGNFCISGHNWTNMLKRLSEMQVGDTFYLINRETKTKVNYQIYDMYTCVPEDLSCLDQNNDGKREATLITCNPGGLTRLICKAREI